MTTAQLAERIRQMSESLPSAAQVAARIDRWSSEFRRGTRQKPDLKVEQRIAEREKADAEAEA